jgi:lipid II:glycine glycyltransferase (peptidoglycan interpeptide bridge formation enzyme)
MKISFKKAKNRKDWENFNKSHKFGYFLQSWNWGNLHEAYYSKKVERYKIVQNDKKVGILQVLYEKSRFGDIAYIPRGPVIDWDNDALVKVVLSKIKSFFCKKDVAMIRLDPQISHESKSTKAFEVAGFKSGILTIQAENPWIIDIENRNNEELFDWMGEHDMRSKVPNYIRGSVRKGCEIKQAKSQEEVEIFLGMLQQLSKSIDVNLGDPDYIREMYRKMDGDFKVFIGYYKNKPVVSAGIMMYGNEASYLYGASTPDLGNSNASYLLQWRAITHARDLNLDKYNFWGVLVGDDYQKGNEGYGYSYFKRSFGGYVNTLIKPQEYACKNISFFLIRLQQRYRKFILESKGYL